MKLETDESKKSGLFDQYMAHKRRENFEIKDPLGQSSCMQRHFMSGILLMHAGHRMAMESKKQVIWTKLGEHLVKKMGEHSANKNLKRNK